MLEVRINKIILFIEFGVPYRISNSLNRNKLNDITKSSRIAPLQYKFREIHKERWVSPTNFFP